MASVSKRTWAYKGSEKTAWVVRWKDADAHRSRQFDKKRDADRHRQNIEAQALDGTLARNASPMLVRDLCREWILSRERLNAEGSLARSSLERDCYHATNHVERVLGAKRVGDLSVNDVDRYVTDLRAWKNLHLPGKMQAATVRQSTRILAQMLDYAKRRGLVGQNVARDVLTWPEHREAKKNTIRTFTAEEARRLMSVVGTRAKWQMQRSADMSRAVIYLGAFCGLRCGEIIGLTTDAIDWTRRLIRVRHSMDHWDNLKAPKTRAGVRDVPMPDPVADALRAWWPYLQSNPRGLVFTSKTGNRLLVEPFHRDLWRPALDAAGLGPDKAGRRFHFHALRHFYASMMVEARLPDADTARLLGHSNFDMTLRVYTHSTSEADHRHTAPDDLAVRMLALPPSAQELRTVN